MPTPSYIACCVKFETLLVRIRVPEICYQSSGQIKEQIVKLLTGEKLPVVVDVTALENFNSFAIGQVVEIHNQITSRGRRCYFIGFSEPFANILKVTKVDTLINLRASLDKVLEELDPERQKRLRDGLPGVSDEPAEVDDW